MLLFISSCGNINVVKLGEEFSLHIGQNASIDGDQLRIKFQEVVEDSRCPTGVTCIWEGRVSCMLKITYRRFVQNMLITEPGLNRWPPEVSFKDYSIAFHIEPYPEAGIEIPTDEYRLQLRITK